MSFGSWNIFWVWYQVFWKEPMYFYVKTPWMTAIILLYTTLTDLWWKDSGLIGSPIINNWSSNWTEKTQSKMVFWKIRVCTDIVCSHYPLKGYSRCFYWPPSPQPFCRCFAISVDAIAISKIWNYDPLTDSLHYAAIHWNWGVQNF